MEKTTRELLADYAVLLNKFGCNSAEAESFIDENHTNTEFVELAALSRTLKEALTSPLDDCLPKYELRS